MADQKTKSNLGIHFLPGTKGYRAQDIDLWAPEIQAMGFQWVVLHGPTKRAISEDVLTGFMKAEIEPILLLDQSTISPLDQNFRNIMRMYRRAGIRFVSPFPSPNVRSSWQDITWSSFSPVDRFLEYFRDASKILLEEGLFPVCPSMKSGGDYWDLAFFEALLTEAHRTGNENLLQRTVFAVDMDARNRPIYWGAGGSQKWTEVRPYASLPEGSQDHCGFQRYAWFEEIGRRVTGGNLPLLGLHAGASLDDNADPQFPEVDLSTQADINLQAADLMQNKKLEAPILAMCFWHLFTDEQDPAFGQSWFRSDGTVLPVVDQFKQRHINIAQKKSYSEKSIRHYVLLPDSPIALSNEAWNRVKGYLQAFHASCGYSMEEASLAEKVTIVGDTASSTSAIQLRDRGCVVEYLSPDPQ